MDEEMKEHTTFLTRFSTFSFEVKPLGLINASYAFRKMIDNNLQGFPFSHSYLDDFIVHSKTIEEHLGQPSEVFDLLLSDQIMLRVKKCIFCLNEVG